MSAGGPGGGGEGSPSLSGQGCARTEACLFFRGWGRGLRWLKSGGSESGRGLMGFFLGACESQGALQACASRCPHSGERWVGLVANGTRVPLALAGTCLGLCRRKGEGATGELGPFKATSREGGLIVPAPAAYQTECMNFVKLLHSYNRTHLLACGTGAFHPTCAFVEVGHRLEVRPDPGREGGWGSAPGPGCDDPPHPQEPVLRLDLRRLEDGKGKSPYDPRHRAASVLVGESEGWDPSTAPETPGSPQALPRAPRTPITVLTPQEAPQLHRPPPRPPRAFRAAEQPSPRLQGRSCIPGWLQTSWAGTSPSSAAWAGGRVSEQSRTTPAGSMVKDWWGWWEGTIVPNRAGAG